jgi:hypothetical protein
MMHESYRQALTDITAFVNSEADDFIQRLFPQYRFLESRLDTHVSQVLDGSRTAWSDRVERAIFERGRNRIDAENRAALRQLEASYARRGYDAPPGLLAFAESRAYKEAADRHARVALETAEKRAEREVQHLQLCLNIVASLRQTVAQAYLQQIQNLIAMNSSALDYAKTLVGSAVQLYNLLVDKFRADLEWVNGQIRIWEAKIKFLLVDFDIFKALVEAEVAKGTINEQLAGVFRTRVSLQQSKIDLLAQLLNAERLKLEAAKVPIEVFGEQIRAYQAYVNSKEAELAALRAGLEGDRNKLEVELAKVRLYETQVGGIRAKLAAAGDKVNLVTSHNRNLLDLYKAELESVFDDARLKVEENRGNLENNRYKLDLYRHNLTTELDIYRLNQEPVVENQRLLYSAYEKELARVIKAQELFLARTQGIAQVSMAGANIMGELAGAAASGINSILSASNQTIESA